MRALALATLIMAATSSLVACGASDERGASGDDGCEAIETVLLFPAQIGPDKRKRTPESEGAALRAVGEAVPPEQQAAWNDAADVVQQAMEDPSSLTQEEATEVAELFDGTVVWAADHCPDAPPSWRCATQQEFTPVGVPLQGAGADAVDAPRPHDALYGEHADDMVEVDRTDDRVLYGLIDGDGLVTDTVLVEKSDGVWNQGASRSCS